MSPTARVTQDRIALVAVALSRDGLRAVVAGVVGVSGLVGGVELAVAVQGVGDVSADDYTGALSVLGGALLLALSAWIAWTGRKTTGSLVRRVARRCALGTVAFLGAFLLVVPIAIAYITTHTVGPGLVAAPDIGVPVIRASCRQRTACS